MKTEITISGLGGSGLNDEVHSVYRMLVDAGAKVTLVNSHPDKIDRRDTTSKPLKGRKFKVIADHHPWPG